MNTNNGETQEELFISNAEANHKAVDHLEDTKVNARSSFAMAIRASGAHARHQQRRRTQGEMDDDHPAEMQNMQESTDQPIDEKDTPSNTSNEAKHSPDKRTANGPPAGINTQVIQIESASTNKITPDTIIRRDCVRSNVPPDDNKSSGSGQTAAERKASIATQNEMNYQAAIQKSCEEIIAMPGPRSSTTTQRRRG